VVIVNASVVRVDEDPQCNVDLEAYVMDVGVYKCLIVGELSSASSFFSQAISTRIQTSLPMKSLRAQS
jgi:hypothetical protein